jgi:tetratricopeptide (TPR) repeat protein
VERVLDHYLGSVTHACGVVQRSYNPPPPRTPRTAVRTTVFANRDDAQPWFDRERANLTSAVTYAAEHGYHDHAWRLADPVTTFFDRAGRTVESLPVRLVALHSTRAVGHQEAEVSMLLGLGMVHMTLGDNTAARRCFAAALPLAIAGGSVRGQATSLHQLGRVTLRQGRTAAALDLYHQAMAIDQSSGNREGLCWAHCRIGQALHTIDQHQKALAHLQQAVWLAHEIGETSAEAASLREIGAIHHELGDLAAATRFCEQALAIAEAVPDLPATAEICAVLCEINSSLHRSRRAVGFGLRAVAVCEKTHDLAQHAHALEVLGNAQHKCGDLLDAVVAWRQSADLYDRTGDAAGAARLHGRVAAVPVFHQELVPIARAEEETSAPASWPAEEESTRPLGGPDRSGSTY